MRLFLHLTAQKIMLVLENNNLYIETNKQTVEILLFALKKAQKSCSQGLLWRGGVVSCLGAEQSPRGGS
jgi:hypothetical protein